MHGETLAEEIRPSPAALSVSLKWPLPRSNAVRARLSRLKRRKCPLATRPSPLQRPLSVLTHLSNRETLWILYSWCRCTTIRPPRLPIALTYRKGSTKLDLRLVTVSPPSMLGCTGSQNLAASCVMPLRANHRRVSHEPGPRTSSRTTAIRIPGMSYHEL